MSAAVQEVLVQPAAYKPAEVLSAIRPSSIPLVSAWACPLVAKLCTGVSEAPSAKACSGCVVFEVWHTAEGINPRFWD